MLKDFGFMDGGKKKDELVLYKDKKNISYSSPKTSFPYINPDFKRGGYIPIEAKYHDLMFQYSELKNVKSAAEEIVLAASNGITKTYVATPSGSLDYTRGDIVFAYRIAEGTERKTYRSAITSYCTVVECFPVKIRGRPKISRKECFEKAGNKTVLSVPELEERFSRPNVYIITLIYNGFFGKGNNVNHFKLKEQSLFEGHPYSVKLDRNSVFKIFEMGRADVQNIIID